MYFVFLYFIENIKKCVYVLWKYAFLGKLFTHCMVVTINSWPQRRRRLWMMASLFSEAETYILYQRSKKNEPRRRALFWRRTTSSTAQGERTTTTTERFSSRVRGWGWKPFFFFFRGYYNTRRLLWGCCCWWEVGSCQYFLFKSAIIKERRTLI